MSALPEAGGQRESMPLILAISATPLLVEAIARELAGTAVVCRFPAGREDAPGLVAHVAPDVILVDRSQEAEALEPLGLPLVHVSLERGAIRARRADGWQEFRADGASTAVIRNVLLGELFAAAAHRRPATDVVHTNARPGGSEHGGDPEAR
jgi:hypothetical protein